MPQTVSQSCGMNQMQLCGAKVYLHWVIIIISINKDNKYLV